MYFHNKSPVEDEDGGPITPSNPQMITYRVLETYMNRYNIKDKASCFEMQDKIAKIATEFIAQPGLFFTSQKNIKATETYII